MSGWRHILVAAQALGFAFAMVWPNAAAGTQQNRLTQEEQLFPQPPFVSKQVRFWEKVFQRYPSSVMIIHDLNDPEHIIDFIDFRIFGKAERSEPLSRKERSEVAQRFIKRYNKAALRFKHHGDGALRFGAIEKRLYQVYRRTPEALSALYRGQVNIRSQSGLADDFLKAAATAQNYLPYMEKVFGEQKLPLQLTRIAFVESMFNTKAVSKVGASGIWQFMPGTARKFIYVNKIVDERNSPFKATKAAAQLLSLNYEELGSWPLAITAYNHGRHGMARAAKSLGTRDIGEIIKRYESPSFGFASRNFYAEFLAAAATYEKIRRTGRITLPPPLPETIPLVLQKPLSVSELIAHTPLTREILSNHNPCLLDTAFSTLMTKPLPKNYEIKVPRSIAHETKLALEAIKQGRYARR